MNSKAASGVLTCGNLARVSAEMAGAAEGL